MTIKRLVWSSTLEAEESQVQGQSRVYSEILSRRGKKGVGHRWREARRTSAHLVKGSVQPEC